jgi:hypothetical protein
MLAEGREAKHRRGGRPAIVGRLCETAIPLNRARDAFWFKF